MLGRARQPAAASRDSRTSTAAPRTSGTTARSTPPSPPLAKRPAPLEGGLGFPGQGCQFFSCIQLEHELADLPAPVPPPGPMGGFLVFRPRFESALAGLHEPVHPPLDLGLLEVMLAAHIHEL